MHNGTSRRGRKGESEEIKGEMSDVFMFSNQVDKLYTTVANISELAQAAQNWSAQGRTCQCMALTYMAVESCEPINCIILMKMP